MARSRLNAHASRRPLTQAGKCVINIIHNMKKSKLPQSIFFAIPAEKQGTLANVEDYPPPRVGLHS